MLLESYGLAADKPDPSGATALHVAARAGDPELVELLTGPLGKADIALRDEEGNQALHVAAACGHLGVVKNLVENAGADLGERRDGRCSLCGSGGGGDRRGREQRHSCLVHVFFIAILV